MSLNQSDLAALRESIKSRREWMAQWGPESMPNWADKSGGLLPITRAELNFWLDNTETLIGAVQESLTLKTIHEALQRDFDSLLATLEPH